MSLELPHRDASEGCQGGGGGSRGVVKNQHFCLFFDNDGRMTMDGEMMDFVRCRDVPELHMGYLIIYPAHKNNCQFFSKTYKELSNE